MNHEIEHLEKLREETVRHMLIILSVSVLITLTIVYLVSSRQYILSSGFLIMALIGIATFAGLGFITGYFKKVQYFKDQYKKIFVEKPFREAFGQVSCDFKNGISRETIKQTGLIRMGNRYKTNDNIKGTYKNVGFERADIKIQQHTSTGKSSYTVTYFNGRWLILDFNKTFHFDLQIIGKGFYYTQKKGSIFSIERNRRHKVEMEDIAFNKLFDVYAQDDHEAFFILTPQFISTLKEMYASMDGALMLGFIDNKLHVAINTKRDAMEASIFRSVKDPDLAEVRREINTIIYIIDSLNLDRSLYK